MVSPYMFEKVRALVAQKSQIEPLRGSWVSIARQWLNIVLATLLPATSHGQGQHARTLSLALRGVLAAF